MCSTSTRASSGDFRKRAEVAAAQAALEYPLEEAEKEIQKAKLQAKFTLVNFEREAAKEEAEAFVYENAESSHYYVIFLLRLP